MLLARLGFSASMVLAKQQGDPKQMHSTVLLLQSHLPSPSPLSLSHYSSHIFK